MRPGLFLVLLAITAAVPQPGDAQGHPLRLAGVRSLDFGDMFAGLPTRVAPTDGAFSGQFRVRGRRGRAVLFQFLLPAALVGPGGAELPLTFGPADGSITAGNRGPRTPFDPRMPYTLTLPRNEPVDLFLGGTVSPPLGTPAGPYTSVLTLTAAYLDI